MTGPPINGEAPVVMLGGGHRGFSKKRFGTALGSNREGARFNFNRSPIGQLSSLAALRIAVARFPLPAVSGWAVPVNHGKRFAVAPLAIPLWGKGKSEARELLTAFLCASGRTACNRFNESARNILGAVNRQTANRD